MDYGVKYQGRNMMREFVGNGRWAFYEKQVREKGTNKSFTLTQPKQLFLEDYYVIRRAIAVDNCPANVVPESDFYVYEFTYFTSGAYVTIRIVDQETAQKLIGSNLELFLQGRATKAIENFFMKGE